MAVNKFIKSGFLKALFAFLLVIVLSPVVLAGTNGIFTITLQNELGKSMSGATFNFRCTGGTLTAAVTDGGASDSDGLRNGVISITSSASAYFKTLAGCDGTVIHQAFTVASVSFDGFVDQGAVFANYSSVSANTATTTNKFTLKVTGPAQDELSNNLTLNGTTASVSANSLASISFYSGGFGYVPAKAAATTLTVGAPGYVNKSQAVTPTAKSQTAVTISNQLPFTIKVNSLKDELGNAITLNGTTASASIPTFTTQYSGGAAYLPVTGTSAQTLTGGANGYVNQTVSVTPNKTVQSIVQVATGGVGDFNTSSLPFAYKFNVYTCCGTNALTGAKVTAGDSGGTLCKENSGVYYCAVPPSNVATKATASKAGYDNGTVSYILRASNATAQIIGGNIYPILNSSNGGGGGFFAASTPVPVSTPTPTPAVSPAVTPTPTPSPVQSPAYVPTPSTTPMPVSAKLFKRASDPKIYVQKNDGLLYWVKTLDQFNSAGYKWSDVKQISGSEFAKLVVASKLRVKSGVRLNVRDSASTKGKVMIRLSPGDVYDKKGARGSWFKIVLPDGREGWISSAYVTQE